MLKLIMIFFMLMGIWSVASTGFFIQDDGVVILLTECSYIPACSVHAWMLAAMDALKMSVTTRVLLS